ncbi:Na(+) H(+) exchange regulatory cofactor NHE-RF2-like [Brachionus plicatilis]|uniref:Na(+) H(+) exchange regulatory cofactor NHE-RF2-like n=1 Tax=Brachionus plicatilis TaxID=10195 RepID=A0A3M7Q465_BRAPC|nr:Na(+) H(+) exchange regulatory cofactor NHE-RF2-like [Brachionus plicatilis]
MQNALDQFITILLKQHHSFKFLRTVSKYLFEKLIVVSSAKCLVFPNCYHSKFQINHLSEEFFLEIFERFISRSLVKHLIASIELDLIDQIVTHKNKEPKKNIKIKVNSINFKSGSIISAFKKKTIEGDKRAQSVGPAYSRPSTETPSRPHSATPTPIISPMQTDNALDDLIFCTITRTEPSQSIGMSLTKSDKDQQSNFYPMVTDVERGAPAEQAGIMVGDIVIEINGKSTLNKQNKEIRPWIESSGNNIDFIVKRDKSVELKLRQDAKVITDAVVETAVQKIASPSSSQHLSRKESFSQKTSAENSPRLVHKEIHMSSSKLQDYSFESSSSKSNKSPKTRNQSEPALEETIRSENTVQSSSPVSRRSASTYTLPRDAPIPRLCRVRAYEESLGFTVSGSKSAPGVFKVTDVAANSAAANSGLRNNDYIIEVSGVNVETLNYTDLIAFIRKKKQEDDLQLLVADRPTLEWYKKKKVPISSQVVPKMQYIETLLKEELEREMANTDLDQSGLNTSENYAINQ